MEMETSALVIARYDFTNNQNKRILTTKLLVKLKDYGSVTLCTTLANDLELLSEILVKIKINKSNKVEVVEIIE